MIMRAVSRLLLSLILLFPALAEAQQATSLPPANLPLSGAETLYLVQGGVSKQTPVSTLQGNGSFVSVTTGSLSVTGSTTLGNTALTGKLILEASSTGGAGLNLPQGGTPNSPVNGDIWTTSSGLFAFLNGSTVGPFGTGGGANNATANNLAYYATTGNTVSGLATANSGVLVTSGSGVPSISTTLPGGLTIGSFIGTLKNYANAAALPVVTGSNSGQMAFVSNCLNGSQTGINGTGCVYTVDNSGTWQPVPTIPTQTITVGGQALNLGQSSTNQGNGTAIATATGSFTNGHCVSVNAGGAFIDAGGSCGGGGGSGTVNSAAGNSITYYALTGTAVSGIAAVNNAVVVTNGVGVPSEATTLPSALTIPAATLPNGGFTGAATYVGLTGTGKLVTAASTTTQAGLNLPAGAAPTSPVNGDIWTTTTGLFARVNGTTVGPFGTSTGSVSSIATSAPISGGTITTSGTISCPTCALTTNGGLLTGTSPVGISVAGAISCVTCVTSSGGGALTATSPVSVSSAGLIACATCATTASGGALSATSPMSISGNIIALTGQTGAAVFNWDTNTTVTNQTYYIAAKWAWATGSITSVSYLTGGTSSPAFNIAVQINGTPVTTCTGITVSSGSVTTTACGTNSVSSGGAVTLVITSATGTPNAAMVQVNYSRSAI